MFSWRERVGFSMIATAVCQILGFGVLLILIVGFGTGGLMLLLVRRAVTPQNRLRYAPGGRRCASLQLTPAERNV